MNEYVKFEWKGSQEVENGVSIFTVIECARVEVEMTTIGLAHQIFNTMQQIAEMAYEDGRENVKELVRKL